MLFRSGFVVCAGVVRMQDCFWPQSQQKSLITDAPAVSQQKSILLDAQNRNLGAKFTFARADYIMFTLYSQRFSFE
jgi:hypothetical protein